MTSRLLPAPVSRRGLLLITAAFPVFGCQTRAHEASGAAGDERPPSAVRALLTECVQVGRDSLGYVAGLVGDSGTVVVAAGQSGAADDRPLDGASVFEIGSITKLFTALLLADMAARGEVALTDPVATYLPIEGRPQPFDGHPITLLDLATYTSGLPRMPGNFHPRDPGNPYADYTVTQLYQAVSTLPPRFAPGAHYEYSNLGFGLLGHALALRAGRSFEELVVSRICDPLGLDDTRMTLTPSMRQRLVPGHDDALHPVPNWDLPTLSGAGGLRSTAIDMLRFLDACQRRRSTPLAAALASLLSVRRSAEGADAVAIGWFVRDRRGDEVVWKNGGTGGYSSFIGMSPRSGNAAVLLSNAAKSDATTRIGFHLVNPAFPLPT